MKISEVAKKTNTPASSLRYYEKIGLLPKVNRISTQRVYPDSIIWRVNFINAASATGFSLADIKSLFDHADNDLDWRKLAKQRLGEIEIQIQQLNKMTDAIKHIIQFDCLDTGIAMFSQKPDLVEYANNEVKN